MRLTSFIERKVNFLYEFERELKLRLDKNAYLILMNKFEVKQEITQVNHYFDTEKCYFSNNGSTLRIREQDNNYLLTMKLKVSESKEKQINSKEFSKTLTKENKKYFIKSPNNILVYLKRQQFWQEIMHELKDSVHELKNISYLGNIKNNRIKLMLENKIVLDLDKTEFPNGALHYELEIENLTKEQEKQCLIYLENMAINFEVNTQSKYKRFIEIVRST